VIDYTTTDFTREEERYDLILDTKTTRAPTRYLRVLRAGGAYVTVGGESDKLLRTLLFSLVSKPLTGKRFKILGLKPNQGLEDLGAVMGDCPLQLHIDGPFAFDETPYAIRRFGEARHIGKVIIKVRDA